MTKLRTILGDLSQDPVENIEALARECEETIEREGMSPREAEALLAAVLEYVLRVAKVIDEADEKQRAELR